MITKTAQVGDIIQSVNREQEIVNIKIVDRQTMDGFVILQSEPEVV